MYNVYHLIIFTRPHNISLFYIISDITTDTNQQISTLKQQDPYPRLIDVFYIPEAVASILGNPNVFIESGSVLNLTCLVKHALSKPAFIIWKHGSEVRIYVTPFNDILLGSNKVVYYNIATKTGTLEYFFSPLKIQKLKRKQTIFFKKKKQFML